MWLRLRKLSPNLELPLTYFHRSLYVHKLHATTSQMQPCRYRSISWSWWSPETDLKPCTAACKKWMQSSITIAASSVCKQDIFTDRLNKIQLRTFWCSIFYICSKQTMNVIFHCTFVWICADFSYKTAFISYHVMIAKTRVLKFCCLLFDWTDTQLSFEKLRRYKSWEMIGLWWL